MAEINQGRSSRDNPVRKHFISECRDSRIVVQAKFSPNMLRIYRRHFDGVSRAAYLLRFYCRIGPGENVARELTSEIASLIEQVNANVQKKIEVADKMLKKEGIRTTSPQFETINATIIDPIANQFLKTLIVAQSLDEKLSALWLACAINDEQKSNAFSEIDKDLRSIQMKTRALFVGVRTRVQEQNLARQQSRLETQREMDGINEIDDSDLAVIDNQEPIPDKSRKSKQSTELDDQGLDTHAAAQIYGQAHETSESPTAEKQTA